MISYYDSLTTYLDIDDIQYLDIPLNKYLSGDILTLYSTSNNIVNFYLTLKQGQYLSDFGDNSNYSLLHLNILNSDNKYINLFNDDIGDALVNLGVRRENLFKYYYSVPLNYFNYNNKTYIVVDFLPYFISEDRVFSLLNTTQYDQNLDYNFCSSFGAIPFILGEKAGSYSTGLGLGVKNEIGATFEFSDPYYMIDPVFNNIFVSGNKLSYGSMTTYNLQKYVNEFWGMDADLAKVDILNTTTISTGGFLKFVNDDYLYKNIAVNAGFDWNNRFFDYYVIGTGSLFGFLNSYYQDSAINLTFNKHEKQHIVDSIGSNGNFKDYNPIAPLSGFGSPFFSNYTIAHYGVDLLNNTSFKPSLGDNYIEGDYLLNTDYSAIDFSLTDFRMGVAVIPIESIPSASFDSAITFANAFNGFLELNFLNVSLLSILLIFLGISLIGFIKGLS